MTGRRLDSTHPVSEYDMAASARLVACHDCGTVHALAPLQPATAARCIRCDSVMRRSTRDPLDKMLALSIASAVLYGVALFAPLMALRVGGNVRDANLLTGIRQLWDDGMGLLAALVLLTSVIAPGIRVLAMLAVSIGVRLPHPPPGLPSVFRFGRKLAPWAMVEVYMLGVGVAYVKLVDLATIQIGAALWALMALMAAMAWTDAALDPDEIWDTMERRGLVPRVPPPTGETLVACHDCGVVCDAHAAHHHCPRCGAGLHRRKPDSLNRAAALCAAGAVLYIPANAYPVMTVISLGRGEPDTILSGVVELAHAGMWPLALLVFVASITVPVLKLVGMTWLLWTTWNGSPRSLRRRTQVYRVIEFVGRWSMVDVFMIAILVALVRLGALATIEPGVGAVAFAGVVVLTMIAASSFDPRLMWDAVDDRGLRRA